MDMIGKTSGRSIGIQERAHVGERKRLNEGRLGPAREGLQFQTKESRLCSVGRETSFRTGLSIVGIGP